MVETDSGSAVYKTNIKNYDQEMYQQNLYQLISFFLLQNEKTQFL